MAHATQTFTCDGCHQEWSRPAVRGQRPRWCPGCRRNPSRKTKALASSLRRWCSECGSPGLRPDATYCSHRCGVLARMVKGCDVLPPAPKLPKPKTCRIFVSDCATCGRCFVSRFTVSTCSDECKAEKRRADHADAKHRRRARQRRAFVAPVVRRRIYERDDWTCQLCGRHVLRNVPPNHPEAPSIDHIVPLAAGGTHEPANVQTAHLLCNSIKGARHAA